MLNWPLIFSPILSPQFLTIMQPTKSKGQKIDQTRGSQMNCPTYLGIRERNKAWSLARHSGEDSNWIVFRQLRNRCTTMVRKAKSEYILS